MVSKRHTGNNSTKRREQRRRSRELSFYASKLGRSSMMRKIPIGAETLGARLYAVEEDVRDLKRTFESGFAGLHAKFDEKAKIPWPALALILGIVTAVGGLAYWPIRAQLTDMLTEHRRALEDNAARNRELRNEMTIRDQRIWDQVILTRIKTERLEALSGRN